MPIKSVYFPTSPLSTFISYSVFVILYVYTEYNMGRELCIGIWSTYQWLHPKRKLSNGFYCCDTNTMSKSNGVCVNVGEIGLLHSLIALLDKKLLS